MNGADKDEAHTLELLGAIEQREDVTQRDLARRLGIALGLANSYLRRCIQMGLVKVQQVPPNRYSYYLTPKGFAEKSRLVARYLTGSFRFYREAGSACRSALLTCQARGFKRIGLCGISDLAEIAVLKNMELELDIVGTFHSGADRGRFMDRPVWTDLGVAAGDCDGFLLTELERPAECHQLLLDVVGEERVVVPEILAPFSGG